jgi:hypothetical protein
MNQKLQPYALTLVLLGITVFAGISLTAEWFYLKNNNKTLSAARAPSVDAPPEEKLASDIFKLPELSQFDQLVERPLFMETRRPSPPLPPGPPAKTEPPAPVTFKLMGVLETPEGRMALIADAKGKYKRFKLNDSVDGWEIASIKPDGLILQNGGTNEDLALLKKKPKGTKPPQETPLQNPETPPTPPQAPPAPPHPGTPMAPPPNMGGGMGAMEPQDYQGDETESERQEAP